MIARQSGFARRWSSRCRRAGRASVLGRTTRPRWRLLARVEQAGAQQFLTGSLPLDH
jgi:hypothetical protein